MKILVAETCWGPISDEQSELSTEATTVFVLGRHRHVDHDTLSKMMAEQGLE